MKRIFDIAVSLAGIVIASPLMAAAAVAVLLTDGAPVLFRQERVGRHGRPFRILKFRTMRAARPGEDAQLTVQGDPRITRVGAFLRDSKLDELPQLFNVLRGDMSLVGPRPEVPRYVEMYSLEQRRVLDLKPGITDLASIQYRHENRLLAEADDPERAYVDRIMPHKISLNLRYAESANPLTDLAILFRTVLRVLH